jgi:hypothetical protein
MEKDALWSLFNRLDSELSSISALVKGTRCVREHEPDENAEIDLLSFAEIKLEESRERLKEMQHEYRNLEQEIKKDEAQPPA